LAGAALQRGANDAERKFWWLKLIAIDRSQRDALRDPAKMKYCI
jgi:hypothetical protein